ncbi:MAG: family 43 glycosylhydrolase [Spirochaetales bacterium]|nr:family 43 glycosylhydrolase [Spirochaetales bacterium]
MTKAENPILGGNFADPSIIREGDDYFMVHGGGGYRSLLMWHSRDLVHWDILYSVLEGFEEPVWAPDLVKVKDRWYIYCFGKGVWVTHTDDIRKGQWSRPEGIEGVEGIDPGHFQDEDGKRWLFVENNRVYPLNEDGDRITGGSVQVCPPWPVPDSWDVEGECCEAPKLLQRQGWIYLTVAQGGTQGPPTSHSIISFRSRRLSGPWESSPYNPISHCDTREEEWWSKGHGTLIDTVQGDWFIVYHGIRRDHRHLGRQTLMEPVEWTEDGWFRIPEDSSPDKAFTVNLPASSGGSPDLSLFSASKAGTAWYFLNSSDYSRVEVRNEELVLHSIGTSLYNTGPALLHNPYRSQDFSAQLEVQDGAAGGLCMHYSAHLSFGIALEEGYIRIYDQEKPWLEEKENMIQWPHNTLWLKLKDRHGVISPWFSADGLNWNKINRCGEVSSWNSNAADADGFYGCVRPGLFSCKSGQTIFKNIRRSGII